MLEESQKKYIKLLFKRQKFIFHQPFSNLVYKMFVTSNGNDVCIMYKKVKRLADFGCKIDLRFTFHTLRVLLVIQFHETEFQNTL